MIRIASLVAAGLLASAASALPERSFRRTVSNTTAIDNFKDVPSSAELHWVPCYDKYRCANLEVPLDYADPDAGTTVVAFIRQDAANGTGQDILFNPGGPGGSGIAFILSGGGDDIISAGGGMYNVVSFDPRGVNNSGIALTCFPENREARDAYFGTFNTALPPNEAYYQAVSLGQWCAKANNETVARYAGTTAVVQDLVHFTELQAAQDGENPEEALVWYYGVSYGTVIGQTLAALYPDRVGRIIVDANVNAEDHYNGLSKTATEDADDGYDWFFKLCYEAGPQKCAFAGESSSPGEIKRRFDDLLEKLEKTPLILSDPQLNSRPEMITKSRVLNAGFSTLYAPSTRFPILALGLAGLEKDNATIYLAAEKAASSPEIPGPFNYDTTASQEVLIFVTAIDAAGRYPISDVDEYITVSEEIRNISFYAGKSYAETNVLINAGLDLLPPESQSFPGFKKTKTKNPVLFINTSADPITPISSAKHMSQYFEGSVVLEQNSVGHGFTSVLSSCSLGHVLRYLKDGSLPEAGTVCETDTKPLVDSPALQKRSLSTVPMHFRRW
ncbi:TAP-like protein-domain-containing protein [Pyrenochaeta sp. MPI-SDFR-AT-0127]|nr:TAP-like protein-domain-containing protein [Pyrenochaeta sp. MPI-SDFR-AT-0127]